VQSFFRGHFISKFSVLSEFTEHLPTATEFDGSLGVLIEAKRKGIIPLIRPHIEILKKSEIHFSNSLLEYALQAVGE